MLDLAPAAAGSSPVSRSSGEDALRTFQFDDKAIRVVDLDGSPWFVALDVLEALRLKVRDAYNHARALNDDERAILTRSQTAKSAVRSLFPDKVSRISLVSESGLYKLILRANSSPTAKRFQDWVTRDVLPSIRKDGAYVMGEEKVATGEMHEDEFLAKAWQIMQRKLDRLTAERDALVATVETQAAVIREELEFLTVAEMTAPRRPMLVRPGVLLPDPEPLLLGHANEAPPRGHRGAGSLPPLPRRYRAVQKPHERPH